MQFFQKRLIISVFLVVMFAGSLLASGIQNYSVRSYSAADGLPHKNVTSIAQDQNGFIWIATWDGLSRYDGYEFKNYYHRPGDSTSIPYFTVNQVLVDRYNSVWLAGYPFATAKYNPKSDNFIRFSEEGTRNLLLDTNNEIWIHYVNNLKKWDQSKNQFITYDIDFNKPSENPDLRYLSSVEIDQKGNFWLFFSFGSEDWKIYKSSSIQNNRILFDYQGVISDELLKPIYSGNRIRFVPFESVSGKLWLLSGYGLFEFDNPQKRFNPNHIGIPPEEIQGLTPEFFKKLMGAITCYNIPQQSKRTGTNFRGEYISAYLIDRQGLVWLGFFDDHATAGGLARFIPVPSWFTHYFDKTSAEGSLSPFFPILKDKYGTLWAPLRNKNLIYQYNKNGTLEESKPIDDRFWKNNLHPRSLLEDKSGIWIGYNDDLLVYYDFASGKYSIELDHTQQKMDDYSKPSGFVHLAKEGDDLIIFSYHAIYRYNPQSKEITLLSRIDEEKAIYSMQKDGDIGWIVGYARGTVRYFDRDFKLISEYKAGSGLFNVEAVCKGDNNEIWAALLGEGVARIDMASGKSELLTTADGLSNNTTYSILKDNSGNCWITTNQGISRYNPVTRQFRQFGKSEGLRIEEFNSDGFFMSPDGEMFFAGMGGVVSFFPDTINLSTENKQISPLMITEILVSGIARHFQKAVYETDTLWLQKGDDNFRLGFACLDFRDAEKIRYRYRLSGEENEFTETNHRNRFVNYANLSPGRYLFELESTNSEGDWVASRKLLIVIPPFYYQTRWFLALIVALSVVLILWMIYSYNRQLRLRFEQKHSQLRLESLRGQMNPHFIFNTLNSINYFISQNDRLSANRYIADFSRLMRTILGNMTSDYIPFSKEFESINDYLKLEHLRFSDKFDYSIEVQEGHADEGLLVFPGMVQPFVENAIWHGVRGLEGRKGMVKVSFYREGSLILRCTITDDGIGRKLSQQRKSSLHLHHSRGLKIVQERLNIVNALSKSSCKISFEDLYPDRDETGTNVTIDIPCRI
jgi:ligand-binding sensor domain-containing protein